MKYSGFIVMIWGTVLRNGHSELVDCLGSITSVKYVSIFQVGILPIFSSGRMIKNESLFMEYGVHCRTAENTLDWLLLNGIKMFCGQVSHQI